MTGDVGRSRPRRWVRWFGALLAIVAIFYLIVQFIEHADRIDAASLQASLWLVLPATFGYFLCGFALVVVWWLSTRIAGAHELRLVTAAGPQLASQLGKYLPGNVAHFAARHFMMRRNNIGHAELVAAGIIEATVLVLAASLIGLGVLRPIATILLEAQVPEGLETLAVSLLAVLTIGAWFMARKRGWINATVSPSRAVLEWFTAIAVALVFFLGMAACFLLVSEALAWSAFRQVAPWVAASWLLGFIVPGAPGGIGIREFVLVFGLTPLVGEPSALLAAGLFRLVTVGGDGLMALVGAVLMNQALLNRVLQHDN